MVQVMCDVIQVKRMLFQIFSDVLNLSVYNSMSDKAN